MRRMPAGAVRGDCSSLRPATLADRRAVWEWLVCSDLTALMMGPPKFAEKLVPTWEEFCEDYEPYFFDGSRPERGRSFIIERLDTGEAAGHISYECHGDRPQDTATGLGEHRDTMVVRRLFISKDHA